MLSEIITIGDELLIGQVIDTNSAWIAALLNQNGISVHQITSVSDNKEHILEALHSAAKRADLIFVTGGLGPTRDDITKLTLCAYFNTRLKLNRDVLQDVEQIFARYNKPVTELNRKQAEVPEGCTPLRNKNGTAPGMWFEKEGKIYVSLPGVPYEMKPLMTDEVIPRLLKRLKLPAIIHKNILTIGIGESALAAKISVWEDSLAKDHISLAYLPAAGMVRLRLSATGGNSNLLSQKIDEKVRELRLLAAKYIYGYDNDTLEELIGKMLVAQGKTLSVAESCTGGYLSHRITAVPGSSHYFKGGVVCYMNEIKVKALGVKPETLEKYGAVSQQTAEEMAQGVRQRFATDYSLAITGFAGPSGGTAESAVGTIWIAFSGNKKTLTEKFMLGDNRERNIHVAALMALNTLRKEMIAETGVDKQIGSP